MISTKGRYAIRVMAHLAERNEPTSLEEIAERQEISLSYLKIISKVMVGGGLVEKCEDGFRLTREPSEYIIGEILDLTEGSLAVVDCLAPDAPPCPRAATCKTLPMWKGLNDIVHDYFHGITLSDLVDDQCLFNNMLA